MSAKLIGTLIYKVANTDLVYIKREYSNGEVHIEAVGELPPSSRFSGDFIILLNGVRIDEMPELELGDTVELRYAMNDLALPSVPPKAS